MTEIIPFKTGTIVRYAECNRLQFSQVTEKKGKRGLQQLFMVAAGERVVRCRWV